MIDHVLMVVETVGKKNHTSILVWIKNLEFYI